MSNSQQTSWSDNPNAPKVSHLEYHYERAYFAGCFTGLILYGIVVVLFFRCIAKLFDPVHRGEERIKWGLVSYTVVMFLLLTVGNVMHPYLHSISYIDNREFPGARGVVGAGPLAYQLFVAPSVLQRFPSISFALSNWLADGFMLYRCYIIYSENLWVVIFPCLVYLGTLAMGIIFDYQTTTAIGRTWTPLPYYSISLSLNILLTLMIVSRLIVHARNTRAALGMVGIGGLYKAIVTMLVESSALYGVSSLLVIVPLAAGANPTVDFSVSVLRETQVIAPLLIVERVASKGALESNSLVSGRLSPFKARSRWELAGDSGTLLDGDSMSSVDLRRAGSGELRVGVETTTESQSQDV